MSSPDKTYFDPEPPPKADIDQIEMEYDIRDEEAAKELKRKQEGE